MDDNYNFSVGCIVRKENKVLLVRHTYGGANGKLLIPENFVMKTSYRRRQLCGRFLNNDRKTWYLLLEMDYIDGVPTSDMHENSEALFCEISEALMRSDCTEVTKVSLRKILDNPANYFHSDIEYKSTQHTIKRDNLLSFSSILIALT